MIFISNIEEVIPEEEIEVVSSDEEPSRPSRHTRNVEVIKEDPIEESIGYTLDDD